MTFCPLTLRPHNALTWDLELPPSDAVPPRLSRGARAKGQHSSIPSSTPALCLRPLGSAYPSAALPAAHLGSRDRIFFSMMSVKSLKSLILPQVSFYAYTTAFNIVNGNASYLFPRLLQMRLHNVLLKKALPIIILTHVSAMNVVAARSLEPIRGIEVMDKEGNVMGYSRKAGTKAVKDTAASRVVLFGTSAFIPEVFSHFFVRTQFFRQYPWSLWTFKLSCTVLVMGLMVPVSFSIFPQIERIQRSELEKEIQSATEETELFYNRGV
ncbi:sideroflexin-4 isoform X3 [Ursus arctos]|uniref:sideroflexin-4 isoform X3 n=1 Tax=Ursus arctos TaxID=9644 RepID=UPI002546ED87|nr:sideroflexin-4 isoform X3 [Ursus arctos]